MAKVALTAYWITSPFRHAPIGFGITAWTFQDAWNIIHMLGYGEYLPEDMTKVHVIEGIKVAELDPNHVVPNMGPINLRGMWYPKVAIGVPRWAEQRWRTSSSSMPRVR